MVIKNKQNQITTKIQMIEKELSKFNIKYDEETIYDIILNSDGANLMEELRKKKEKEKFVLNNINGELPNEPNFQGRYRKTIKKNGVRKDITGTSYYELVEKLYDYLSDEIQDKSIENIFALAYERRVNTTSNSAGTYKSYKDYYKRFVSEEFAKTDISLLTIDALRKYTKNLVIYLQLDETSFKKYKQLLNLIFEFAFEKEIIQRNLASMISPKDYVYDYKVVIKKDNHQVFNPEQLEIIECEIRSRISKNKKGACSNGYGILLAILTGMRVGEICALKWCDVDFEKSELWIHEQQLKKITERGKKNTFYDVPWTKNEKKHEGEGRKFPIYKELYELLMEIKALGIDSEYVIAHEDKSPIHKDAYSTYLRRLCRDALGLEITNNHAFRKTLNSYLLLQVFSLATRAKMLGHSPETNLRNYTFDPHSTGEENADLIDDFKRKQAKKDDLHPIYTLYEGDSQKKYLPNLSKLKA